MDVRWLIGERTYEEISLFGRRADGTLGYWSFTSDGKRTEGWLAEATDLHPAAIAFEGDVPAGRARQAYGPPSDNEGPGFVWAVEARAKKGWSRFAEHRYRPA